MKKRVAYLVSDSPWCHDCRTVDSASVGQPHFRAVLCLLCGHPVDRGPATIEEVGRQEALSLVLELPRSGIWAVLCARACRKEQHTCSSLGLA